MTDKQQLIEHLAKYGIAIEWQRSTKSMDEELREYLEPIATAWLKDREKTRADTYDDCKYWLEDRLTSKKDVAVICDTRAKVLRGEMEAPKSKFSQGENQ